MCIFRYNRVMHWQMTAALRARPAAVVISAVVACLLLAVGTRVFGQLSGDTERAPSDFAAVTAETDKLRSEQFAIGEQLLKDFPKDFEALRIMGYVYSGHGDHEKMAECWRQCVELQPESGRCP